MLSTQLDAAVSGYTFSQSTGTYTPITGGTLVATATGASGAASLDDITYNVANGTIPFSFTFDGIAYTGLNINTNGHITFGTTAPSSSNYSPISGTQTYAGAISAFGGDLNSLYNISGNTGSIRYETLGSSPNQEFVIQFSNFRPYSTSTSTTIYWKWNFQIRLKEADNSIDIVYDAGFLGSPTSTTRQVGLRGATNAFPANINNRLITTGTHTWNTSANGTANSSSVAVITTNVPVSGKTFTWAPPTPCLGTPAPGNTLASASPVCSASNFTLSLEYSTTGTGVSYLWESSTDGGFTYGTFGTDAATQIVNQTVSTHYQCTVTCSGSGFSSTSSPVLVNMLTPAFPEDFSSTLFAPCGWARNNTVGLFRAVASSGGIGVGSAEFNFFSTSAATNLELTSFTFAPTSGAEALVYDYSYASYTGTEVDALEILTSDDGGATYISLAYYAGGTTGPLNNTGLATSSSFTPTSGQWATNYLLLPAGTNGIMFRGISDFGNNLYIDNVTLGLPPSCGAPSLLNATNITGTSADLDWTCTGCTGTFYLEYGPTGFTPGSGTVIDPATSPENVSLSPATTYDFYVKQICGATESSNSGPSTFTTNVCGTEVEIFCGTQVSGTIDAGTGTWNFSGTNPNNSCGYNTNGKEAIFIFTSTYTGLYQIDQDASGGYVDYFFKPVSDGCNNTGWTCIKDLSGNSTSATATFNLTSGEQYYILLDPEGTSGGAFTFQLVCPGTVPSCIASPTAPSNGGAACEGASTTLSWAAAAGATAYDVYLDAGPSATTLVSPDQTGTSYSAGVLAAGTYTWLVVPKNIVGSATGCTEWSFTVNPSPSPGNVLADPIIIASLPASISGNNQPCFQSTYTGSNAQSSADVFYQFTTGICAGTIQIGTCTASFDTYIHLLDATGVQITYNDDACGSRSTINATVAANTTYYIVVEGYSSNTGTYTLTVDLTSNLAVTALESSPILCFGGSTNVDVSATGGTAPYTGTGSFNQSDGTQIYSVTDDAGCAASATLTLVEPSKVEGSTTSIPSSCGLNNGSATVTALGGTGTYTYLWSDGQTTATATNLLAGNYSVVFTDGNSCTGSSTVTVSNSGAFPDPSGPISGPPGACRNTTGIVFSVAPVSGATDYTWALPTGAIGTSTTNSISLSFDNTYNGGFICVTPSNSCGNSTNACSYLQVTTVRPSQPGFINGDQFPCGPGIYTYSITPSYNAFNYVWSVSGTGVAIMGGNGTNTIQVSIPASFGQGSISVRAENCIGVTSTRTLTLTGIPAHSNALVGNAYVCAGTLGEPYSIASVNGAGSSYTWATTGDMTIASTTGRFCTVDFGPLFTTGVLSITTSSSCGSFTRSFTIRSTPIQPGSITGPGSSLCGQTGVTYSIASVTNATTYTWLVPAGVTVTANTGTSITVDFGPTFTGSGNICVSANNLCGSSVSRCYTVSALPAVVSSMGGLASVCKTASGVTYNVVVPVTGATHYTWYSTNGVVLTTIGIGLSATADFGFSTNTSTTLTVRANNLCGIGQPLNKVVTIDVNCRNTVSQTLGRSSLEVYPNPSSGKLTLKYAAEGNKDCKVRIMDVLGQTLMFVSNKSSDGINTQEIDITKLVNGIYIVGLNLEGNDEEMIRVVKE